MAEPDDDIQLERLAYELSFSALASQEATVDELRRRTGTLLAASSLVASFLGGRAATGVSGVFTAAALAAFVLSVAASVYVLVPKRSFIFGLRGSVLLAEEQEDPRGIGETYRLAAWIEEYVDANQRIADRLYWAYQIATGTILRRCYFGSQS